MSRRSVLTALLTAAVLAGASVPAKDKKPMADEFTGTLISMETGQMGTRVAIYVEAYTPDDVAERLVATLAEKGQQGLLNAIADERAGTLRLGTADGYPIAVARQRVDADGRRRIFLATSRPLAGVGVSQGRVDDYPFGVVELELAADGSGEGKIVGAAQLAYDAEKKSLGIRSFAIQPGRLSNVKATKPKN